MAFSGAVYSGGRSRAVLAAPCRPFPGGAFAALFALRASSRGQACSGGLFDTRRKCRAVYAGGSFGFAGCARRGRSSGAGASVIFTLRCASEADCACRVFLVMGAGPVGTVTRPLKRRGMRQPFLLASGARAFRRASLFSAIM